jgi:hypothetical protein
MKTRMTSVGICIVALLGTLLLEGCSVYMAANKPGPKDMNILRPGTPRGAVLREFGAPQVSRTNSDGLLEETWTFQPGESLGWKLPRILFNAAADVFTLGLWEIVATPTEMLLKKDQKTFDLVFDKEERIKDVRI